MSNSHREEKSVAHTGVKDPEAKPDEKVLEPENSLQAIYEDYCYKVYHFNSDFLWKIRELPLKIASVLSN
jgi:hypothetical protein